MILLVTLGQPTTAPTLPHRCAFQPVPHPADRLPLWGWLPGYDPVVCCHLVFPFSHTTLYAHLPDFESTSADVDSSSFESLVLPDSN